ncbi:porin [Piscinibacter sp.]|jgi:predicted porin|uniref:porin n=1 Tax=Piscinibacter sp. TaxID=1903157 RepID=UPI002F40C1CD
MKKSLLALAVLALAAGTASAQSSVTIYGKVDLGLGKTIASNDKQVRDAGGSRLGFRGQEDLGGGMFAIFGFEHRLNPDTGASTSGTFWNGYSWVGVRAGFGQLTLGRHYVAAFTDIQNQIDPFGGDTVAALRDISIRPGATSASLLTATTGAISKTRVADSLRYDITAAGVKFAASFGEAPVGSPDRPWSVAANYSAGPLFVGAGYEDPEGANDKLFSIGARYGFGPVTLRLGYSDGKNNTGTGQKIRGFLVGATIKAGPGDVLVGYGMSKNRTTSTDLSKKWGVGYRYPMSKRTFLYADIARDSVPTTEKGGYDVGIQHNF